MTTVRHVRDPYYGQSVDERAGRRYPGGTTPMDTRSRALLAEA